VVRERWQDHIAASLMRPVLFVDEAQEMKPAVLNELRLLCAAALDARALLTVVLSGDPRLPDKFRAPELLPLGSRIRVRLTLHPATPQELGECLRHALAQAGNSKLMTDELVTTLVEHAAGNYRILMTMASELLDAAIQSGVRQLDEKLCLETFAVPATPERGRLRTVARSPSLRMRDPIAIRYRDHAHEATSAPCSRRLTRSSIGRSIDTRHAFVDASWRSP
jgi:hypothetical protein